LIRKFNAALFSLTEGFRMKKVAAFLFGLVLLETRMRFLFAQASWRMPVTCHETFIPAMPPEILNRLFAISSAM